MARVGSTGLFVACLAVAAACGGGGGSSCSIATGCGEGQYCTMEMDLDAILSGSIRYRCKDLGELGEECKIASDRDVNACQSGAYCASVEGDTPGTVCKPVVAAGAACPGFDTGPFVCTAGNLCAYADAGDRTCQPGGAAGVDCTGDGGCQAGLFCDDASHECVERRGPGGACEPSSSMCFGEGLAADHCTYWSGQCSKGLYCRMVGITVCGDWLDCENFERCCVTAGGTECRDDQAGDCQEPVGECGE